MSKQERKPELRTALKLPSQISCVTSWHDTIGINFSDGKISRIELKIDDMIALRDVLNQLLPLEKSDG